MGFEFGWQPVGEILDAYDAHTQATIQLTKVYLVALVFTLYKIDRYAHEGSPEHKLSKGLRFLEETLDMLERELRGVAMVESLLTRPF